MLTVSLYPRWRSVKTSSCELQLQCHDPSDKINVSTVKSTSAQSPNDQLSKKSLHIRTDRKTMLAKISFCLAFGEVIWITIPGSKTNDVHGLQTRQSQLFSSFVTSLKLNITSQRSQNDNFSTEGSTDYQRVYTSLRAGSTRCMVSITVSRGGKPI